MEALIVTALFLWGLMRYAGSELMATARGTEPPRVRERRERAALAHERAMAKMARRSGPTVAEALGQRIANRIANPPGLRAPGPARCAVGEWWADSWDYATDRRRRRHDRAAAGDLGRQRAARAVRDWFTSRRDRSSEHRDEQSPRVWADAEVIDDDVIDAEVVDDPTPPSRPSAEPPAPPDQATTEPPEQREEAAPPNDAADSPPDLSPRPLTP